MRALVGGLIDYAGLFPPAAWTMERAVSAYAGYLKGPDAWALGRFIVPVSRLEEFRRASAPLLPRELDETLDHGGAWPISAIVDGDLDENLDSVFAFNRQHAEPRNGLAIIDAVEIKVPPLSPSDPTPSVAALEDMLDLMPEGVYPFFELPVIGPKPGAPGPDLRGCVAALAGADAGAKVRTGGVTPGAFPPARAVADFLAACHAADVPFKATAGLHHAVRGEHPLTYEPGCPRGVMHGFLNVFLAAAWVYVHRADAGIAERILMETDASRFRFGPGGVSWAGGGPTLDVEALERTRDLFALSYGSCSFEEPVGELRGVGLV